jgi:hypothetical protein
VAVFMVLGRHKLIFSRRTPVRRRGPGFHIHLFCAGKQADHGGQRIVLQFTAPVFIVVLSRRFSAPEIFRRDLAAVLLTLWHRAVLLRPAHRREPDGEFCGIAAGVSFAAMYVINGEAEGDDASAPF